ncbi:hypothetical protein Q0Z83_039180 [Actinoplanes sichuanensis]|uniref:Uncharacterized protein n=1 Tax=Actinoplanes sichuanensis TaxID=512349 RepID=A0ABW4AUN4_9ACTN|nr:hypothetical protein [Actinoplanes sichuanensis]BEL05727.1 hypothetical protein Q0Z83_039180 [Actinoplanes sichuanensis]
MPYDPVLAAIATATNEALTEHVWNYDTTDGDPVTDIAAGLTRAASEFITAADMLTRALTQVADLCRRNLVTVTGHATVYPGTLRSDATGLNQLIERFDHHRETLLTLYGLWRRHRPTSRDLRRHHLLVQPYDPDHGMVTLATDETGLAWFVVADPTATAAYGLTTLGGVIGSIWSSRDGWQATAFTDPTHRNTPQAHQLPPAADEHAACRALLRWWAFQQTPNGAGRTPADLTPDQRAALIA